MRNQHDLFSVAFLVICDLSLSIAGMKFTFPVGAFLEEDATQSYKKALASVTQELVRDSKASPPLREAMILADSQATR